MTTMSGVKNGSTVQVSKGSRVQIASGALMYAERTEDGLELPFALDGRVFAVRSRDSQRLVLLSKAVWENLYHMLSTDARFYFRYVLTEMTKAHGNSLDLSPVFLGYLGDGPFS